jgi:tungstate transport system ATP-binding protein
MSLSLRAHGVAREYGNRIVLADCTHTFEGTGVFVLMGGNGSGKSTFLRICALLEPPTRGRLSFLDGRDELPQDLSLRRRMTLVLPRVGVFNTTVARNTAYGLRIRNVPRRDCDERVHKALAFVGLEARADQHARTLSSGETQRLGIARALVLEPEILFLDEPTASVDEENTRIIESIILRLRSEERTLLIMTTHDRDQAERLADHVLRLERGALHVTAR